MENREDLAAEHPLCDRVQLAMVLLFFAVWGMDSVSFLLFERSTVLIHLLSFPLLILPAIMFFGLSVYLVKKAHDAVFGGTTHHPKLIDTGVYARVRHPMYLGILLFCLGFFFLSLSLFSLGVLIVFFVLYDRMTTYEEKELLRLFGEEYTSYRNRVSKWFPKI
jgi:protein-S-isoprenylcysteine O-methyltransferase Ste14